ncbi:MAG: exo-alpha-sialidase [Clostridia bacterium]|nr:exo-alpha-sialidase [Clostridia bacterium]
MDWRNIRNGLRIPSEKYCDQPYIVKTEDGHWLCSLTTGEGDEGVPGQYVMTARSADKGRTWTDIRRMEPKGAPENSYSVLLKTSFGRIYCFYNFNKDNIREIKANDPPYEKGICKRVDSLGYYVFRYSDDNGMTWSDKRGEVPVRRFRIDRENPYGGDIMFFWNVGKPLVDKDTAYLSLHKVGEIGEGFFVKSEGVLIKSPNIMTEPDIDRLEFETLPEGDTGIRTPKGGGKVAEEHSYAVLGDGSFFTVYRTIDGRPAFCYSRDKGRSWDAPAYMPVKHPRAANFIWKLGEGKYLYWFHNHGGKWYEDRNPAWCLAGKETDGPGGRVIEWSQPEILLYDDDPYTRMSYPDVILDEGVLYVTETQKDEARLHAVDGNFLRRLFSWDGPGRVAGKGLIFKGGAGTHDIRNPGPLLVFSNDGAASKTGDNRSGFSIDLWLNELPPPGDIIFDTRRGDGSGLMMTSDRGNRVEIMLGDGRSFSSWKSDFRGLKGKDDHIAVIIDGGPKTISFIINGRFNDGGTDRQFGWGRYNPNTRHADGSGKIYINKNVEVMRMYDRVLMTVEACLNFKAGK